jgi:hypothetical protein
MGHGRVPAHIHTSGNEAQLAQIAGQIFLVQLQIRTHYKAQLMPAWILEQL